MLRWTIVNCSLFLFWNVKRTTFEQTRCVLCDNGYVINLTTKKTKKIENQTAEQARCERWEKEAVAVVDDDVVSVVVVVVVVVDDDDLFLMLLLSLLIAMTTIKNIRLVARDGRRRPPPRTPQPTISKTRS